MGTTRICPRLETFVVRGVGQNQGRQYVKTSQDKARFSGNEGGEEDAGTGGMSNHPDDC